MPGLRLGLGSGSSTNPEHKRADELAAQEAARVERNRKEREKYQARRALVMGRSEEEE